MNNPDEQVLSDLIDKIEGVHGPLDFVVANAGIAIPGMLFEDGKLETFERTMNINFLGNVKLTHVIAPRMCKRERGTILYVGS